MIFITSFHVVFSLMFLLIITICMSTEHVNGMEKNNYYNVFYGKNKLVPPLNIITNGLWYHVTAGFPLTVG